uniref:hypothetical protein n=1 Tax=Nocardiopsis quinghaiensis TaxID=464995 RepID=UPI00168017A4
FPWKALLRFRFVVSSLYQVFRTPPNRRFVVFLIGVKPVRFRISVEAPPEAYRLRALLEPVSQGKE